MIDVDALLKEYSGREELLESICRKVHTLVEDLLHAEEIRVHSVTFRVKTPKKLKEKLLRPNKNYAHLDQVTDQVGLRIITYYEDEVDRVASLIRREFVIDEKNSIDKRIQEDPEKFTYSSLHYVCTINDVRLALGEYQRYSGTKFEIQIRSILQHAWAEIQHDWYDLQDQLPRDIQRRFSRLAGLLDLADSEFLEIRKKKLEYERSISVRLTAKVPDMSDVSLDKVSIRSFILEDSLVKELDNKIARIIGFEIADHEFPQQYDIQLGLTLAAGMKTLEELRSSLTFRRADLIEYVTRSKDLWIKESTSATIIAGTCILSLSLMLLAMRGDEEALAAITKTNAAPLSSIRARLQIARDVLNGDKG